MINKKQMQQMMDYLVAKLEGSSRLVLPVKRKLVRNIESNYILFGDDSLVLLVDQIYPADTFSILYRFLSSEKPKVFPVFFKDGETFFRSAAENNYFKQSNALSLKNYTVDDMRRMIILRPEERDTLDRKQSPWLQYYQPESDKLCEELVSFKFVPVVFDYSHIDSRERFRPQDKQSVRLFIWNDRENYGGPLEAKSRFLGPGY